MRIFVTGVSCVGKTTISAILASRLGYGFFDLDEEVERFFGTSLERLQNTFLTMHSYRKEAAKALLHILAQPNSRNCVIALPPSGLMGGFLRVVKKAGGITVVLVDTPGHILDRITFYDIDSHPIEKELTQKEKAFHLREIKKDITYFRKTYARADMQIDISGFDAEQAAKKMQQSLTMIFDEGTGTKHPQARSMTNAKIYKLQNPNNH
jgi:shikimate kinase